MIRQDLFAAMSTMAVPEDGDAIELQTECWSEPQEEQRTISVEHTPEQKGIGFAVQLSPPGRLSCVHIRIE